MIRFAPALAAPVLVTVLLLAGCSAPSEADREATFTTQAEVAAEEAGLAWDDAEALTALEFGRALCADWAERSTGDRPTDVAGSQSSVQFSGESAEVIAARVGYVEIASEELCPI
jgi:hypothetical protein